MYPDPNHDRNIERRQQLIEEEEAYRLRQEERRLEAARESNAFNWITNSVYFLVGLLEILLGIRFILRLLGANTDNTFAQFIYNLSDPFMAPFSTLFVSPVTQGGQSIFDVNNLVAMLVYALLGWIVVAIIRFVQTR